MTKTNANPRQAGRSFSRAWPIVTLTFAALLFGALGIDWDALQAQEAPKQGKTKTPFEDKKSYVPKSKNLPVAKSLTKGKKVDSAALTKIINQEIAKRLSAEKVTSAGICSDEEFVRRVYLDIIGVIPTATQVTTFVSDKSPERRAKLVDELLANSRFGNYLAENWAINMIPRESNNRALKQKPFEIWLAEQFNKNTALDKLVYEIVTVTGEIDKNPAGTYFVANPTVDKITDNVTRNFLGVQLQCAQCHNHPFTDWKQTEYWAMAAFFMKTRVNGTPQAAAKKGVVLAVMETSKAPNKKSVPESAKKVPAKFLQGEEPTIKGVEMRPTLGKWMTSADNRFFARAMVNRFWYQLMGRGLVNPVDDMHDDNAATHPALLATLTEQFKLNGFDIKFLVRSICNSEVYQRSSATKDDAGSIDLDLYTRREIRVLMPEQLFDSLTTILGTGAAKGGKGAKEKVAGKKGPGTARDSFIAFFRVEDANPLDYQNGIPQALRMMNSPFTSKADVTAGQITNGTNSPKEAIEKIYLTALSRQPTSREIDRLTAYVNRPGATTRSAYGDILWALLNSSEFVLNH